MPAKIRWLTVAFCFLILSCWAFPPLWYTKAKSAGQYFWLSEQLDLKGWAYSSEPVGKSVEATLVADRIINGEFANQSGRIIRVFSSKRYRDRDGETSLFGHTPDICWTSAGWRLEPTRPDVIDMNLHGVPIQIERRIFVGNGQRELVYFFGLTGGQPLPYRLDFFQTSAKKFVTKSDGAKPAFNVQPNDFHRWTLVWDAFMSRRPYAGPKQFIRISTPVSSNDTGEADQYLQLFIPQWLTPADFQTEADDWKKKDSAKPL